MKRMRRELPEPDHSALISTALLKTSTFTKSCAGMHRFMSEPIIRTIKSFRKKN